MSTEKDIARMRKVLFEAVGTTQALGTHEKIYVGRALDAMSTYAAEREAAEREKWQKAERELSDAYVRLRCKIPGALKTPHAPTPAQIWETTERALDELTQTPEASAPQPMAGEWIEWGGGVVPIAHDTSVEIKFWNGETHKTERPHDWMWQRHCKSGMSASDIIAYRLVPSQPDTGTKDYAPTVREVCDAIDTALAKGESWVTGFVALRDALQRLSKGNNDDR